MTQAVDDSAGFEWLHRNRREAKPRRRGVTEIRGPYYSVLGRRGLEDLLEIAGGAVDALKYGGGSFAVMPPARVIELNEVAHAHDVLVSTGGFIEYVLTQGSGAVDRYVDTCKRLGFDIIELSAGFISLATDDWLRLIERVQRAGLKAKPEVGVLFGAGGDSQQRDLDTHARMDPTMAIKKAKRFLEAGAYMIMVESEGITENTDPWRTDVSMRFAHEVGVERLMFEAADPRVFSWYVQTLGPDVNLFVDHSQAVQLEVLRRGLWGPNHLWGRVVSYDGGTSERS
ncbi:MAG TPA: phosphosulfolactate synthase [Myxococcota bacterium]|nr:phosphosulfolactate synthase [Myxococcota bacterium]